MPDAGAGPGDAGPFGPLDPAAARVLARTAAAHPRTRWCVTVTDQDRHAVAHGCARGPRPWAGPGARAERGDQDALDLQGGGFAGHARAGACAR
jgi:hypothetical protein